MCFENGFISVRGYCGSVEPRSGLFINDLAGISIKRIVGIADEELVRGEQMFNTIEKMAIELTVNDFLAVVTKKLQPISVIGTHDVRFSNTHGDWTTPQAGFYVIRLTSWELSPYSSIRINSVNFYAQSAVSGVEVRIVDGVNTYTKTINVVAGLNTIRFDKVYQSTQVEIHIPSDELILINSYQYYSYFNDVCGGCTGFDGCMGIQGFHLLDGTYTNSDYNGVGFSVSCVCDTQKMACAYLYDLRYAVWYKFGILLAEEMIGTDRINPYANASKIDAERMLLQWNGGVDEATGIRTGGEYWKRLNQAIDQILPSLKASCNVCFSCSGLYYTTRQM